VAPPKLTEDGLDRISKRHCQKFPRMGASRVTKGLYKKQDLTERDCIRGGIHYDLHGDPYFFTHTTNFIPFRLLSDLEKLVYLRHCGAFLLVGRFLPLAVLVCGRATWGPLWEFSLASGSYRRLMLLLALAEMFPPSCEPFL
jgi:hypothetical protein